MPGLLKIKKMQADMDENGKTVRIVAFDIHDLLTLVSDVGPTLAWSVFPTGEGTDIGADLSPMWEKMIEIADLIHQTIWGTYIGCKEAITFTGLAAHYQDRWLDVDDATPAYYEVVKIAFQACDGCFWLVYAHDDTIFQRIRSAFQNVETLRSW